MLLIRTKNGYIEEVKPRFVDGRLSGFSKVNSNLVYDYDEVSVLSDAEIEAIRKLPEYELTEGTYGALEAELIELKNKLNKKL